MKHLKYILTLLLSLTLSTCFAQQREASLQEDADTIYSTVEELPQYPGGLQAVSKDFLSHYVYPKQEREAKTQGMIILKFVVEREGTIGKVQIMRSLSPACDAAAIAAVKQLKRFTPGKEKGVPVRTWLTLPVRIRMK